MKKVFLFLLATMQLHDALTSDQMPTDYFDPFEIPADLEINPTITFDTPPLSSLQPYQPTPTVNYSQASRASIFTAHTGDIPLSQNQNQNYICQFCMTRCTTSSELAIHEEICIDNPKNFIPPLMLAAQPPQPAQLQQQPFVLEVPQQTRTKRKKISDHHNNTPTATIVTDIQTPQPPTTGFSTVGNISPTKFLCLECPSKDDYKSEKALIEHSKTHSSTITTKSFSNWRYNCPLCNRNFAQSSGLKDHLNRHYDIKIFLCALCNKEFVTKKNFDDHYKRKHDDKSNSTIQFNVGEFIKKPPTTVIDPHSTSIQKFLCLKCTNKKNLGSKEALQKHYRETHPETAENPKNWKHICELCDKKLAKPAYLKDHLNAHYDIRKEKCRLCRKKCITIHDLKKHIQSMHPEVLASAIDFDTTDIPLD